MMAFVETILVIAIVTAAAFLIIKSFLKKASGESGSGCGCGSGKKSGCSNDSPCSNSEKNQS